MSKKSTNEYAKLCLIGLREIKKKDPFDYKTFYPAGEGTIVQKEAEGLIDDISLFPDLVSLLKSTPNRKVYWWIRLILYRLLRNTKSSEIGEFIIDLIKAENDGWRIECLLGALDDNGGYTYRIAELSYLLNHKRPRIRLNTLRAIGHSTSCTLEKPLAQVLETSKDQYELYYAALAMREVGSKRSLDVLKPLLYHKKQDLQIVSLSAMGNILKETGSALYIELLEDAKWPEKWAAVASIHKYCGDEAVSVIIKRIKKLLRRKRSGRTASITHDNGIVKTELILAIEYIDRYRSTRHEVLKAYEYVQKRWEYVLGIERTFLSENIDAFFQFKGAES